MLDRSQDLINLGAYVSGSNPPLDGAIRQRGKIESFLKQDAGKSIAIEQTLDSLGALASSI